MTSPDPFILQKFLAEAEKEGCEYAVIETSSHSIFFNRNYGIDFDTVAVTNISQDHLDLHGSMDEYVKTKLRLFEQLVFYRRKPNIKKASVINMDMDYAAQFLSTTADIVYSYGFSDGVQITAKNIEYQKDGTKMDIKTPGHTEELFCPLKGAFNVPNILCAIGVLMSVKIPLAKILVSLRKIHPVAGRLEEVKNNLGFTVYVDYAHTEASLQSVLQTIRNMQGTKRIITLFGATGDRDRNKRPKMGKVADTLADVIILTDDDTYTEDSLQIINEVKAGIKRQMGENFWIIPNREDAIRTALITAQKGDVILLAGKGSESVQVTQK